MRSRNVSKARKHSGRWRLLIGLTVGFERDVFYLGIQPCFIPLVLFLLRLKFLFQIEEFTVQLRIDTSFRISLLLHSLSDILDSLNSRLQDCILLPYTVCVLD